jgi:eukaryotic-like serine/threonine-protein kinase
VAIKAIQLADEFDPEDLEQARTSFFREAEMAGRLSHPHIVTIYDAGEDRGTAYIAMELLRGQHLVEYTSPVQRLPTAVALEIVARLADALHYAHQNQVVHRDIKPANIMFDAPSGELKITDFGIARLTDSGRTRTGVVLGTPSFMSPEQLQGRPVTGRSDLFSLAVSLYQLLTGQLPFRGDSMPSLMIKIAQEPHPRICAINPALPPGLDAFFERALAKDPAGRYDSGASFAQALRDLNQPDQR